MFPAIKVKGDPPRVELFLTTDPTDDRDAFILEPAWDEGTEQEMRKLPPSEPPSNFIRRLLDSPGAG